MRVIVLGAGVIGVSSAWYLARAGHEVTVLERNAAPACETSFANGGQISVSHAEPWANPAAPRTLLRWQIQQMLGRGEAPLLFHWKHVDPALWAWGLRFLRECSAARTRHNTQQLLNLGYYSRANLQALRAELDLCYEQQTRGILSFYTDPHAFAASQHSTRLLQELGCSRQVLDVADALRIEPALTAIAPRLVGAVYASDDESGDAHGFTTTLAQHAQRIGVRFRFGVRVQALHAAGGEMHSVEIANEHGAYEQLAADAYVLALGCASRALAAPLGVPLQLYPAKGYSLTLTLEDPTYAPTVSLSDDPCKLVFSRLGNRLRVAGTAELGGVGGGYGLALNRARCAAMLRRVQEVFPNLALPEVRLPGMAPVQGAANGEPAAQYWSGLRPTTPGNVPYIGMSRIRKLFLNTGHGTLGWTHGCGSGRAIANLISGKKPEVDFAFTCGPYSPGN